MHGTPTPSASGRTASAPSVSAGPRIASTPWSTRCAKAGANGWSGPPCAGWCTNATGPANRPVVSISPMPSRAAHSNDAPPSARGKSCRTPTRSGGRFIGALVASADRSCQRSGAAATCYVRRPMAALPQLGPGDLVLCPGTLPAATFRVRAAAAAAGGFSGIGLWLPQLRRAHAEGLSDADLRAILTDHALVVTDVEAITD